MRALAEFALGAAAIGIAGPLTVPARTALVLISAGKAATAAHRRRKPKTSGGDAADAAPSPAVDLVFQDLCVTVETTKGGEAKQILGPGVSGVAKSGRLLAIMGPSGGGKTTLLNVLAGQLAKGKGIRASGRVVAVAAAGGGGGSGGSATPPAADGAAATPPTTRRRQAYVEQEDAFYSQLTVRETLELAAALQYPNDEEETGKGGGARSSASLSPAASAEVASLLRRLGLSAVADTRVGGGRTRGISGGERKRLAIACELVGEPHLLFADEPTTGLDAFQAGQVVSALASLAHSASSPCTVIASIHQPRSSAFAAFDDLILLAPGGRPVYTGPADGAVPHFAALGHACPPGVGVAEFLADLISIDYSSPDAEAESGARVAALLAAVEEEKKKEDGGGKAGGGGAPAAAAAALATTPPTTPPSAALPPPSAPLRSQLRMLAIRAWRQVSRDKATFTARAASNLSSALIFGCIFHRMGLSQAAIQDRLGLLQVAAVNTMMSALVKTVAVFPRERRVVDRERARGGYGAGAYLLAKLAAEAPVSALFPALFASVVYPTTGLHPGVGRFARFLGILTLESFTATALGLAVGAAAPTPDAAAAIGPALSVVFLLFGGYYVNAKSVPAPLRWLEKTSLVKHAFEAAAVNEMEGLVFDPPPPPPAKGSGKNAGSASRGAAQGFIPDGATALARLGFGESTVRGACAAQAKVLAFHTWTALCILRARAPAYTRLEEEAAPVVGEGGGGEEGPARAASPGEEGWVKP